MTDRPTARPSLRDDEQELSLFALGTILLRNWRRIARWMLAGAVLATINASLKPVVYRGTTSFIPQGSEVSRSGLASLAGQFGVAVPGNGSPQSPEFYQRLLSSRVLLEPVVRDTLVVAELGNRRITFLDLFELESPTPKRRIEVGIEQLRGMIAVGVSKTTGVVEVSVATRWPSVSVAILAGLMEGIDRFNRDTRQGQAAAERRFVEGRLAVAGADLRAAEERMTQFLKANRMYDGSPQLQFENDRLRRDVALKQQVFTSLTQAHDDARVREVRDTPVVTVIEPPSATGIPDPRRRARSAILGLIGGGLVGTIVAFVLEMLARRRREGDLDAEEFAEAIRALKPRLLGRARRLAAPSR